MAKGIQRVCQRYKDDEAKARNARIGRPRCLGRVVRMRREMKTKGAETKSAERSPAFISLTSLSTHRISGEEVQNNVGDKRRTTGRTARAMGHSIVPHALPDQGHGGRVVNFAIRKPPPSMEAHQNGFNVSMWIWLPLGR